MNCIYLSAVLISQRATTQIQSGVPDRISIPLSRHGLSAAKNLVGQWFEGERLGATIAVLVGNGPTLGRGQFHRCVAEV